MQIIEAKIDWMRGYANYPNLVITVDRLPDRKNLRYETRKEGTNTAYFAQDGDFITFFYHIPSNENGYGGSVFPITLKNGESISVRGPWSSNSQYMNMYFTPSVEVSIIERDGPYRNVNFAGHIRMGKAIELIESLGESYEIIGDRNPLSDLSSDQSSVVKYGLFRIEEAKIIKEIIDEDTVIGPYQLVIKKTGMTLEESQIEKNK